MVAPSVNAYEVKGNMVCLQCKNSVIFRLFECFRRQFTSHWCRGYTNSCVLRSLENVVFDSDGLRMALNSRGV